MVREKNRRVDRYPPTHKIKVRAMTLKIMEHLERLKAVKLTPTLLSELPRDGYNTSLEYIYEIRNVMFSSPRPYAQ